jgi:hypothetical protein
MEDFIEKLVSKVGISREQADKVIALIKEHADDIPKWIASTDIGKNVVDKLPDSVGKFFK